jgi:glutathione S-transferase
MLRVFGRRSAFNVQKVMWLVDELELAHEHVPLGGDHGGLDTPRMLAMNPNGLVPVIDDGGTVVWESHAILRYLAARYGQGRFWSDDPDERSQWDRWLDWARGFQQDFLNGVFWDLYRTPEPQRDWRAIERSIANTGAHLALLDRVLEGRDFLLGAELTLADIPAGALLFRLFEMDIARPEVPNVEAWYARLRARPAYRRRVMIPFEELKGRPGRAGSERSGGRLHRLEHAQRRGDRHLEGPRVVVDGLAAAPDRLGPAWVVGPPAHHVDVQLRRLQADLADVYPLHRTADRRPDGAHRRAGGDDFVHQLGAVAVGDVLHFPGAGPARHQHDPGKTRIGLQPRLAELQRHERLGGREEGRSQGELVQGDLSGEARRRCLATGAGAVHLNGPTSGAAVARGAGLGRRWRIVARGCALRVNRARATHAPQHPKEQTSWRQSLPFALRSPARPATSATPCCFGSLRARCWARTSR